MHVAGVANVLTQNHTDGPVFRSQCGMYSHGHLCHNAVHGALREIGAVSPTEEA